MSGKVMGMVLAANLPRVEKFVLVAIADHVTDDGLGCYASEARIVFKTGYDLSYVQKAINRLLARGVLLVSHKHPEFGVEVWNINLAALKPPMPFETWLSAQWPQIKNRRCGRNRDGADAEPPLGEADELPALVHAEQPPYDDAEQEVNAFMDGAEYPWDAPPDDDEEWWDALQEGDKRAQNTTLNGASAAVSCPPSGNGSHHPGHNAPHQGTATAAIYATVVNGSHQRANHSPTHRAAAAGDYATVVNGSHKCGNDAHKRGNNAPIKHPIETSHTNRQTYTGRSAKPLPPAVDARVHPAAKAKTDRERAEKQAEADDEDLHARDRPQTDLQRKVAQLCNAKYLTSSMKAGLHGTVSTAWRGNSTKLPVTYPSPEDEWAANPELFAEYVELCARRVREESGRPPARSTLIESIRGYARYNTGWLDFKKAAEEERRTNPPPKERPLYWDPNKPSWMQ